MKTSELDIQQEFFAAFYPVYPHAAVNICVMPTGNFMGENRWRSFKESGYNPGTLDVTIPMTRGIYPALAFDFKSKNGRPTDEQLQCARNHVRDGNFVFFPRKAMQAMWVCRAYFDLLPGQALCQDILEIGFKG